MPLRKAFLRLLPKKRIQIGKTSEELEGIPSEYFKAKDTVTVAAKCTEDCEYPVLTRELPPTQMICPTCRETTLAGLSHCDKCGAILIKNE
ncbi:MAG: hypothetical protein ACI4QX_03160 [Lachnospiraceae bacterium]